jgi:hypothetical protein
MATHARVVELLDAINAALDCITVGDFRRATLALKGVIDVFGDSRLSSNQEVWQLYEPFLSAVAVCACAAFQADDAARQLFADAVRLKLIRIRP